MRNMTEILATVVLAAACLLVPLAASAADAPDVEPKADALLKKMCTYLQEQKEFTMEAETSYESVLENGQKLLFLNQVAVSLKRPDRLYSHRRGMVRDQEIFFDGKAITLYSRKLNLWASTPAPPTIGEAMDFATGELGLTAPGGDLLYPEAYKGLMQDVISGSYIGRSMVDGVECHQLAFRGAEVDWQIWIQDGDTPLPRKYVITTKWTTGAPQYTLTVKKFTSGSAIPADRFHFTPPEGASKIDFLARAGKKSVENK